MEGWAKLRPYACWWCEYPGGRQQPPSEQDDFWALVPLTIHQGVASTLSYTAERHNDDLAVILAYDKLEQRHTESAQRPTEPHRVSPPGSWAHTFHPEWPGQPGCDYQVLMAALVSGGSAVFLL